MSRWTVLLLLAACASDTPQRTPPDTTPADTDTDADADADTDTDTDADADADTDTDTDPSLITWSDVQPVLADACAPCHVDNLLPSGDLSVDSADDLVGVVDPQTGLAYVEPFDPDASYLWLKLNDRQAEVGGTGGAMPTAGPLTAGQLDLIEAWILAGALAEPPDTTTTDDGLYHDNPLCDPVAAMCEAGCPEAPSEVTHVAWHHRLTASPAISWSPVAGVTHYEIALGTTPGADDAACWADVGMATEHTFGAIYVLLDGVTYYASVRAFHPDGTVSAFTASTGWTVDIQPPEVPTELVDDRAPVDGLVTWSHPLTDAASGFAGFEVAVGTAPYGDDALPWSFAGTQPEAVLDVDVALPAPLLREAWYWVSVRAVDVAGNHSQPVTSAGFITCPDDYVFVPGDDALGSTPFCLARYEMRAEGVSGQSGFDADLPAVSTPDGLPWSTVTTSDARVLCDLIGFPYQLITNQQWQATARSIEREPGNWSGSAVGAGLVNRGHSDKDPEVVLDALGGPCGGTNNPSCEDPASADWSQKRSHWLHNGEELFDLAGNLRERVDGSPGAPDGLWMDFDNSAFTVDVGWEGYREAFAPAGDFTYVHGMGRVYGGQGNLTRGGSYSPSSVGSGGSKGTEDVGVFTVHHNSWNNTASEGFRCVFVPM